MQIDIISYTSTQLACLSFSGIREVRSTQLKKNRLLRQLEKNIKKERNALLKQGIFDSCIWAEIQAKLQAECDVQIEELREALLFYLKYSTSQKVETEEIPYLVDYALSFDERYVQVKGYYLNTYNVAQERLSAFIADRFAPLYLGELYSTLYDEFALMARG